MGWTAARLPRLDGRVVVVTGANSGIGWQTARELAGHGASVVLACRNIERGKQAVDRIRAEHAEADVEVAELDLSDIASIRDFGEGWDRPLNLLVDNAGVMTPPRRTNTVNGFELQFGTNHLGHFVLSGLLLQALLRAESPRVVTVSSVAHRGGGDDVLAANATDPYRAEHAYANSKLANLLFAFELQRRADERHLPLTSTAAHPGVAATGLTADRQGLGANPVLRAVAPLTMRLIGQSAAAGARAVLYAAAVADPGSYTGAQWLHETRGPIGAARPSPLACDQTLARRLWQVSEELTGFRYPWPRSP